MSVKKTIRLVVLLAVYVAAANVSYGQNTGQVFGKVTDTSGGVLPGVTVTLSGSALLQPRTALSSETGTYEFPSLGIGEYAVRFELLGFRTLLREHIQITVGFNAQINAEMQIASVSEDVVVTGVSPIVDIRSTTQGVHFDSQQMNLLPTTRDVYNVSEQAPGVLINVQNVGGNNSGNQQSFLSRGAIISQNRTWADGVETGTTDTGAPFYNDFDAWADMQISTGGADVTAQTAGAVITLVSKSGTDRFKGSTRYFGSNQSLESNNVSGALRQQGASSGNPLLSFQNYGGEVGGPIKTGRAWFWGAYGKTAVRTGVLNFFLKTQDCAAIAANQLAYSVADVRNCLNPHPVDVTSVQYKLTVQPFARNQFSFRNSYDLKLEELRGANDLTPPEATTRLSGSTSAVGPRFWTTGWPPTWKFADQHTFSDRWLVDFGYGRYCQCLLIALSPDSLAPIQPASELTTGALARSAGTISNAALVRNTTDVTTNYFLPGKWGGDHSLKAGFKYLYYYNNAISSRPAGVVAQFNSPAGTQAFSRPFAATFYGDSQRLQFLGQESVYFQDVYTHGRLTLSAGLRWDRQNDWQGAATQPASIFQGQPALNGAVFNLLPSVTFAGVHGVPVWNTFAPRVGITYDVGGSGKSVVKGSYAQYYAQRAVGELSNTLNTVNNPFVQLPWNDANGDGLVQMREVDTSRILSFGGGFNSANPGQTVTTNRIDPNVVAPRTDEVTIGFSKELMSNLGLSVSYVWRRYTNFTWTQRIGLSSANYQAVTFTPAASACPAGARCETVTYFVPNIPTPSPLLYTNEPDYSRIYNGFEIILTRRLAQRWMLNASYAYNSSTEHYDSPASYQDPTNIDKMNNAQYAPAVAGGGLVAPNINAKWVARVSGAYRLAWHDIGLSSTLDYRQGYPFEPAINVTSRPNQAGAVAVLLDPIGAVRLPTFALMDFRIDKKLKIGRAVLQPEFDVFNIFNANTVLAERANQNASNANQIANILAPRVARVGVLVTF
jgi:hypothetical protein